MPDTVRALHVRGSVADMLYIVVDGFHAVTIARPQNGKLYEEGRLVEMLHLLIHKTLSETVHSVQIEMHRRQADDENILSLGSE